MPHETTPDKNLINTVEELENAPVNSHKPSKGNRKNSTTAKSRSGMIGRLIRKMNKTRISDPST